MAHHPWHILIFVPGVLLFGLGLVALVMLLLRHASGWLTLARAFPAVPAAPGAKGGLTSAVFHAILGYNNCVLWKADDEYLHLRLMPPFSWMFHPPMSIPWAQVEFVSTTPRWGLIQTCVLGIPVRFLLTVVRKEIELRATIASAAGPDPGATAHP